MYTSQIARPGCLPFHSHSLSIQDGKRVAGALSLAGAEGNRSRTTPNVIIPLNVGKQLIQRERREGEKS